MNIYKEKWYHSPWLICLLAVLWKASVFFLFISIILLITRSVSIKRFKKHMQQSKPATHEPDPIKGEIQQLKLKKENVVRDTIKLQQEKDALEKQISMLNTEITALKKEIESAKTENKKPVENIVPAPAKRNMTKVSKADYFKYTKARVYPDNYTVIDFETTGLKPENSKIIQIGAVKFQNHQKIDEFVTLINPDVPIPTNITRITGITNDDLIGAPSIKEKLPELLSFIGSDTLVAHNAPFDMKFLLHNMYAENLPYQKFRVVDTLTLARRHIKDTDNHKLETLKQYLGLDTFSSHEALSDCLVTGELYRHCLELQRAYV